MSSSQSRLNESHFVIVSVALFHSLIRTEVKGGGGGEKGRKKKKLNLFSKHSVSLTMSIGFRQIITPRGQNRGRQLFAAELDYSPFCSTAIVQWRRPFGLLLLLVNFLQQLFINKLEILNQLTIPCRGSLNNSSNLEKRDKITCFQTKLEKHYKKKLWYSDTVFENYIKNLILVQCEQSELRFLSLNFRAKSQYWNL